MNRPRATRRTGDVRSGHYDHIPMGLLSGILAGLQTQPAALGFAVEQSRNNLPNIGYARVYPIATIAKILLAQLLLNLTW